MRQFFDSWRGCYAAARVRHAEDDQPGSAPARAPVGLPCEGPRAVVERSSVHGPAAIMEGSISKIAPLATAAISPPVKRSTPMPGSLPERVNLALGPLKRELGEAGLFERSVLPIAVRRIAGPGAAIETHSSLSRQPLECLSGEKVLDLIRTAGKNERSARTETCAAGLRLIEGGNGSWKKLSGYPTILA